MRRKSVPRRTRRRTRRRRTRRPLRSLDLHKLCNLINVSKQFQTTVRVRSVEIAFRFQTCISAEIERNAIQYRELAAQASARERLEGGREEVLNSRRLFPRGAARQLLSRALREAMFFLDPS